MCVWTIVLQLSISFSMVISHRASPPLCSAIHRSSLGWTLCHFSLQRFSLCFLKAKEGGGWWTKPRSISTSSSLLHACSSLQPSLLPVLPSHSPSSVESLCSSLGLADCTVLQGSEGSPICLFFFRQSSFLPKRRGNKKGNYTSNKNVVSDNRNQNYSHLKW